MKKLLSALFISAVCVFAQNIEVGTSIKVFNNYKYETPDAKELKIPTSTTKILITFQKDASEIVNEYLSKKDERFLEKNSAVYIADINKMPTIITKLFALPKLRDFKHTIHLHYEDKFQNIVPKEDEKITLIRLKQQKVESINFLSTKEDLDRAF